MPVVLLSGLLLETAVRFNILRGVPMMPMAISDIRANIQCFTKKNATHVVTKQNITHISTLITSKHGLWG
jgi:hypothetical protein